MSSLLYSVSMLAASSTPTKQDVPGKTLYGLFVVALATSLGSNLLIRVGAQGGWLPDWGRLALAIIGTAPLVVSALLFWRLMRSELDEMLQRIVLEGLAFALVVYVPLAAMYINLRTAGIWTPRLDPPDILMTPALLAAIGIALSSRRYR